MVKPEERTIDLAFSSELPVVQYWGIEILDHSPGAMRMDRAKGGIAMLFNHDRDLQLGILEDCRCDDDKKGRGTGRFSRSSAAEEKFRDVQDGILKDVSVGYQVHHMEEMDVKKLPPDLMEMAAREKLPVYRITDWEPFECSLVTVPADPTVGVGRSKGTDDGAKEGEEVEPPGEVSREIKPQNEAPSGASIISAKEKRSMSDETGKTLAEYEADVKAERERAAKSAKESAEARVSGIFELGQRFANFIPQFMVKKAVEDGMPLDEFQRMVLARVETGKPINTPVNELGLSRQEIKRYSIARAILSQWKESKVDASFEEACHRELLGRLGSEDRRGGILIPYDIMHQRATDRTGKRDLDTTSSSGAVGGYLVGTDNVGSEFIEVLRNRMLIRSLGARILTGLRGSVTIPRRTAGATAYWVAEGVAPTEGSNTYGQLALSPKNIAANVDYTRNLLLQSNPSVDGLVNGDLAIALALGIDAAAFKGTGADGQPTGIALTGSIGGFTGTSLDWAAILNAETDVAAANADAASCAYVTTPAVRALLKARVKASSTWSPIWEDLGTQFLYAGGYSGNGAAGTGRVNGYRAEVSNQLTAATMFFGDFAQLVLAEWGVLELVVDPYTQSKTGIIQVTAFQSVDVGVRYPGAFSYASSIT